MKQFPVAPLLSVWLVLWWSAPARAAGGAASQPATQPAADANAPAAAAARGEVVITATRVETPLREVASSVTVIKADEIERRGAVSAADALRDVPGLSVVRQGGQGHLTSVFLRGAKSEHTKVLVDGVCVNDTISPGGGFDWANMPAEDIERIEVVRGPQSVLYGSDAIGGVIHIITKRGKGKLGGYVKAWAGSYNTFGESIGAGGAVKWLDYYVTLSRLDTKGFSAADVSMGNHERDGFGRTAFTAKVGIAPTECFEMVVLAKGLWAKSGIDDGGGPHMDDPDRLNGQEQWIFRVEPRLSLLDGRWEQKFAFSYVTDERYDHDGPAGGRIRADYHGQRTKFEWQHNVQLHPTNTLTFGMETEEQAGSSSYFTDEWGFDYRDHFSRQTLRMWGYYVQDKINIADTFFTTAGVRLDDYDQSGRACTWRVAPAVWIKETQTKLKASAGTGFKAPTLYQLYVPIYGNGDLSPERSCGWEAGFEQYFCNRRLGFEAVYFENRFRDLIDFQGSGYVNVGSAWSKGVECNVTWRPLDRLEFKANYTYLRTRDEETGDELIRRPRHKFGLDVSYRPVERLRLTAGVGFVGGRDDLYWDPATYATRRVRLAKYTLWNFGAEYDVCKNLAVFGRLDNAFHEKYEEVYGYGTPGCGAYFGVKGKF